MKFLADSMLGKCAKWLRVLGYDTLYQSHYPPGAIIRLCGRDRMLISRCSQTVEGHNYSLMVHSRRVGEQLAELKKKVPLNFVQQDFFNRCLLCNERLEPVRDITLRDVIPDHVLHEHSGSLRVCPCCGKVFWPGSHRRKMLRQLRAWGLAD